MSVQSSSGGERTSGGSAPRLHETLSQFLARILDQLSVSAWLPAAILVTYIVVAACLRDACGQFHKALATLTSLNAATIILITGSVILTTTLTQAFEFEAIRVLEGYWGPRWLPRQIAELRSQRHARRRTKLLAKLEAAEVEAFPRAKAAMLDRGVSQPQIDFLEFERGYRTDYKASRSDIAAAKALNWRDFAEPKDGRLMEALEAAVDGYPSILPTRPTRLGNTLRAPEERLLPILGGASLEGFVQRAFHKLPEANQIEHDQFRQRLDLYCSLVVVFLLSGALGAVLLWRVGYAYAGGSAAIGAVLACVSYQAAVASGQAYGVVLETIAELVSRDPPEPHRRLRRLTSAFHSGGT